MVDSTSISPISLFEATGIFTSALQSSTAVTAASVSAAASVSTSAFISSLLDTTQSTVELSSDGQLLLAVSLFQDQLDALQGSASADNPTELTAIAQSFVDTFNALLGAIDTLPVESETLAGSPLAGQFAGQLADQFTDQLVETFNQTALPAIGIELRPAATPAVAGTGSTLRIDESVLNTALAADAAGTGAQLAGAIESFSNLAAGFVAQTGEEVVSLADLTLLGATTGQQAAVNAALVLPEASSAVPAELLQRLPAIAVVNGVSLSGLDLAVAGVAAGDILAAQGRVTEDDLTAAFLALNSASTTVATIQTAADVNLVVSATTASQLAATAATATGGIEEEATTALAAAEQNLVAANPAATVTATAAAADLGTTEASLALQRLLLDPTFHVTSNLINPAYAALIASSHLSDFASPSPVINPNAFAADFPGPVSPVAMAHAVAYYGDAVGEKFGRAMSLGRVMSRA